MEKKPANKAAAPKKRAVAKEIELTSEAVAVEAAPVKKAVKRTSKMAVVDPFAQVAELVMTTSPVKKRATKSVPRAIAVGEVTPVKPTAKKAVKKVAADVTADIAAAKPRVELSPVFQALAEPALPDLTRENRARLLMQTPTRLYFYWAVKENPWHLLKKTFGNDTGSYTLVLKLTNLRHDSEEIHPCDAAGNWWFDVEPDGEYQAEVGFYAPNRPYFRVIYSNTVETPRRSPSPHPASDARWTVPAAKFAEVLDVAGFTQDAFDVALAGDDHAAAQLATQNAFTQFAGDHDLHGISAEDIRYAMLAIASGATIEDLRFKISPALFAILAANADKIFAAGALAALGEHFDLDETEFVEEQLGSAVYGASLVNFPKTLKTRRVSSAFSPKYNPVSSHSIR